MNSGCAGGGTCTGWTPTYISPKDKLTDGTARSLLKNNEYGASLGCPAFKPQGGFKS